jgi:hypothetical protein
MASLGAGLPNTAGSSRRLPESAIDGLTTRIGSIRKTRGRPIFFSILTRRMLRRGDFTSRDDLANKITTFIETYNGTAKPFRWTYDAKLLKTV